MQQGREKAVKLPVRFDCSLCQRREERAAALRCNPKRPNTSVRERFSLCFRSSSAIARTVSLESRSSTDTKKYFVIAFGESMHCAFEKRRKRLCMAVFSKGIMLKTMSAGRENKGINSDGRRIIAAILRSARVYRRGEDEIRFRKSDSDRAGRPADYAVDLRICV